MTVLYEDKNIVACVKPVGVVSEDNGKSGSVPSLLAGYFDGKGEDKQTYTVHRLDAAVGGVMVYARNRSAAAKLSAQIQNGSFRKEYLAVVSGVPQEKSGIMRDLLFHDLSKNKSYVVDRMRRGVKEAELEYEVLATVDGKSLVKILLHTGRTHQIRVQFASRKMPLVGDRKYGSSDKRKNVGNNVAGSSAAGDSVAGNCVSGNYVACNCVALFSARITIDSIGGEGKLVFSSDEVSGYPWNLFDRKLFVLT